MSDEITEDEVRRAIWKLRSCKDSGVCGILGERLSASSTVCRRHSLGRRNGREPGAQHHCTPNSSEGVTAGTKLEKQHNGNQ